MPSCCLVFPVGQREEVASGAVGHLVDFEVGVGFGGFSSGGIVAIAGDKAELVRVSDQAVRRIAEFLEAAVGIAANKHTTQLVEDVCGRDAVGIGVGSRA